MNQTSSAAAPVCPQPEDQWAQAIMPREKEGYTQVPNWIFDDMSYLYLSLEGKALLPYLIAGPGAGRSRLFLPPGIHKGRFDRFAADMGWERPDLDVALQELEDAGWIVTDEKNGLVLIPCVVTRAANPSELQGCAKKIAKLPVSGLRQRFFELVLERTFNEPRDWKVRDEVILEQLADELPDGLELPEWVTTKGLTTQGASPPT